MRTETKRIALLILKAVIIGHKFGMPYNSYILIYVSDVCGLDAIIKTTNILTILLLL